MNSAINRIPGTAFSGNFANIPAYTPKSNSEFIALIADKLQLQLKNAEVGNF